MGQCGLGNPGVIERKGLLDTAEFQITNVRKLVMFNETGRGISAHLAINGELWHDQVIAFCVMSLQRAET